MSTAETDPYTSYRALYEKRKKLQEQRANLGPDDAAVLRQAREALAAGISVLPVHQDGSKHPALSKWKTYQERLPTRQELGAWFTPRKEGLGIVPGKVSGNLEALDFDRYEVFLTFCEISRGIGHGPLLDRLISGYQDRSPNGAHLLYRCETIEGNLKLALTYDRDEYREIKRTPTGRPLLKSLIETRGEGGFLVVPPSHGRTHPSGKPYMQVSGSLSTIATISADERKTLLTIARSMNEVHEETKSDKHSRTKQKESAGTRPGDLFNARATWEEILEPSGWRKIYTRGDVGYWRRPGKSWGWSATTNYAGSGYLYVFSTSTDFASERGYSKFSAYALLNHNGDFFAAAAEVMRQGYRANGNGAGSTTRQIPRERARAAAQARRQQAEAQARLILARRQQEGHA